MCLIILFKNLISFYKLIYLVDKESSFLAAICSGLRSFLFFVLQLSFVRIKFKPLGINFAAKWMQLAPNIHLSCSIINAGFGSWTLTSFKSSFINSSWWFSNMYCRSLKFFPMIRKWRKLKVPCVVMRQLVFVFVELSKLQIIWSQNKAICFQLDQNEAAYCSLIYVLLTSDSGSGSNPHQGRLKFFLSCCFTSLNSKF